MSRGLVAVTGATGFLGRHLVAALAEDGWRVRVLARRDPVHPLWRGFQPEAVIGALEDEAALARLCDGVQAVVHAAGLVKASGAPEFQAINALGVRHVARALPPGARLVLISSLAAREPQLSPYAASKRAGEDAAREILGGRTTVARPTAIYGPGDQATLPLLRAAASSPVLPVFDPTARVTLVHVEDVARQIAWMTATPPGDGPFAVCDARPEGYGWPELMSAAAQACGRRPRLVRIPEGLVGPVAAAASLLQRMVGETPMLTAAKARELLHHDWSVSVAEMPRGAPAPRFDLRAGLEDTVKWYRRSGLLPGI
jgi:nucleoside-diphosphate-sugar epimerase